MTRTTTVARLLTVATIGLALFVIGCSSGGTRQVVAASGVPDVSSTTSTATRPSCPPGMPSTKCAAIQNAPYHPMPSTLPPDAPPPRPVPESCGASFFDKSSQAILSQQFGTYSCFRFDGGNQWVVAATGEYLDSPTPSPAPGGQMIAVETCSTTDAACLDPHNTRSFDDAFTVSYAPEPSTPHGGKLETSFGTHLVEFRNGDCNVFIVDLRDLSWHGHSQTDMDQLSASRPDPVVPTPPHTTGSRAAHQAAPAATGACE